MRYSYLYPVTLLTILLSIACSTTLLGQTSNIPNYHKVVRKTERKLNRNLSKTSNQLISPRKEEETPLGWWIQEYVATMDPILGKPTPEVLFSEMVKLNSKSVNQRAQPGSSKTQWERRGPNNLAGRSRCVEFDPTVSSGKKVWAGAVTGGLWYNNDISSSTSKWISVSDLWANITVTCIAFDPNEPGTMYVGTGEGWGTTSSSSRGYGIFKSTDSGRSFQHLTNTASYYYVNDIVVRNEAGKSVVYVAVDVLWFAGTWHGGATTPGIYRSTNGGSSFTNLNIRPSGQSFNFAPADFEIDSYNRLWVGTRQNSATGTTDKGGGRILYSDNGTTFSIAYTYTGGSTSRVELGVSPNHLAVYAMIEKSGKADTLVKSLDRGVTWQKMTKPRDADNGISKTDFSRNQAWYDWIIAVNPKDSTILVCGAIDMFYSSNGGSTWGQASKWSNNPGLDQLNCSYVHADIHDLKFNSDGKRLLVGCDGGVFYSADINNNPTNNSNCLVQRNNELLITQFYWGDISQTKGSNFMIAGAQDNGTHAFSSSGLNDKLQITGGDGGYCFISSLNDNKQVASYVYNQFFGTTNSWSSFTKLIDDGTTGKFINPAVLDPLNDLLFTGKGAGTIYRNKLGNLSSSAVTITFGATSLGSASAFFASKSTTGKPMIFIGTDAGKIVITNDASITTPTFTNITGTINAGNISSIFRHKETDTLFVTLSNYGVSNVYFSPDGGKNWSVKDGNLPNMPVWSILVNPNKTGEALIATELGIYGTSNIYATTVSWSPYNNGMGPVKTMALRYRNNDRTIMAVTHGRGVFTSDAWSKESPIVVFGSDKQKVCATEIVTFKDSTLNAPTSWKWTIVPDSGVVFRSGTSNSSQNPKIQFTRGGKYEISLEANNALGLDVLTKKDFIEVTDSISFSADVISSKTVYCINDTFSVSAIIKSDTNLNKNLLGYSWKKNNTLIPGTTDSNLWGLKPIKSDIYQAIITSSQFCVSPKIVTVSDTIKNIYGAKSLTTSRFMDTLTAENVGAGDYLWFKNGVEVERGRIIKAKSNGNYRCVYLENGCYSDSSNVINFNSLNLYYTEQSNGLIIFPTISNGIINIKGLSSISSMNVYDMHGKCLVSLEIKPGENVIDLRNYNIVNGVYMVSIYSDMKLNILNSKIIISH